MDNQRSEGLGYYTEDYQDTEEFEYLEDDLDEDESIEAFGEDDRDDESYAFESDGDDEAIEAYAEDELEDDESYDVEDYGDDESYEAFESDDQDEAFDEDYADTGEAMDMYAAERSRRSRRSAKNRDQIARQKAQARAKLMRMKALAAQKNAALTAKKTQQTVNKKLRMIRERGRVSLPRISKAQGTGYVWAILPNGRKTKMMFKPELATRTDMNRLTRQISASSVKQAKVLRVQSKNIKLLKSAQISAVKSLTSQQLKNTKLLTKQMADGDKNLDKRITKLVSNQKKVGRKQDIKMLSQIRRQQTRSTWNTVLAASAIPLFAAYGDRAVGDNANPFTKKNLFIAGSTTAFLFADDIIDRFLKSSGKKWRAGMNIWNIAAPFVNWAVVYWYMKDKQHERFVTGITRVEGNSENGPISIPVGPDHKFDSIDNAVVVASLVSATESVDGVKARIDQGKLYLTLIGDNLASSSHADVAWKVDTMDPKDQRQS